MAAIWNSPALLEFSSSLSSDGSFSSNEYSDALSYREYGVEFSFNKEGRIDTIFFYSGDHHGFSRFPFSLPHFLSFAMSRDDVLELHGPPTIAGGPQPDFLTQIPICWDRWDYDGWQLHLTYPESKTSILLVTIMAEKGENQGQA